MERKKITEKEQLRLGKLIKGDTVVHELIYRVDIEDLYYNKENGRISTFMSEYSAESGRDITTLDKEDYNDIIMEFIKKSESSESFRKTKEHIQSLGQMEPGIILEDGTVIDGNRRFTCLRTLYKETGSPKYKKFECFILPVPTTEIERIDLKTLELSAQYGTDSKLDYGPIERLADIYKDLVGPNKIFTEKEYITRVNNTIKPRELKRDMGKAEIIWDYLEYIGKPGRWDIARDYKLDGPVQEIYSFKNKLSSDEWNIVYPTIFSSIKHLNNDRTREIRKLMKMYHTNPEEFEKIHSQFEDISLEEYRTNEKISNASESENVIEQKVDDIKEIIKEVATINGLESARRKQLRNLEEILKKINTIDLDEIKRIKKYGEIRDSIEETVTEIINASIRLKEEINNA